MEKYKQIEENKKNWKKPTIIVVSISTGTNNDTQTGGEDGDLTYS